MRIKVKEFRKLVQEALDESAYVSSPDVETAVSRLIDSWAQDWMSRYEPMDPSMAALGKHEWDAQVSKAALDLREEMLNVTSEIEDRLMGGEFYYGGAKPGLPKKNPY